MARRGRRMLLALGSALATLAAQAAPGLDARTPWTRPATDLQRVDVHWQRALDRDQALSVRAALARDAFRGPFDDGPFNGVQALDQRGRRFELDARWQHRGWRGHRIAFGAQVQHHVEQRQRAQTDGAAGWQADVDDRRHRWSVFVDDEFALAPSLRAVVGARLDREPHGEATAAPQLALRWQARPGLRVALLDRPAGTALELEAEHAHPSGWRLRSSFGLQQLRGPGPDAPQAETQNSLVKLDLALPLPRLGVQAGLAWQQTDLRRTSAGAALPAQQQAQLRLQYAPPGSPLALSASIDQRFDRATADAGSAETSQSLALDRQWRLQANWRF